MIRLIDSNDGLIWYQNMVFSLENVYFRHSDHRIIDFPLVLYVFRRFRQSVWCVFRGFRQAVWCIFRRFRQTVDRDRVGSGWMSKIAIFPGE